jgi:hypothetical protein
MLFDRFTTDTDLAGRRVTAFTVLRIGRELALHIIGDFSQINRRLHTLRTRSLVGTGIQAIETKTAIQRSLRTTTRTF